MNPLPQTEEVLAHIAEKAKALAAAGETPLFDVVLCRRSTSGIQQQLASFTAATLEHIQDPMRWIPQFCGGGEYVLNVRHASQPNRVGNGPVQVNIDKSSPGMEPRAPNAAVTRLPNWTGPLLVSDATGGAVTPSPYAGATATPGVPQMTTGYNLPSQPSLSTPADTRERELAQQLADVRAHLARTEAEAKARSELEAERRAAEARVREAEQRAEQRVRESQAATERQIADLRAQLTAQQQVRPPETDWKSLVAVFMPIVQQMLTTQHEMRLATLKLNEDANRRQLEQAEKQHNQQLELMRAITAKPGISDEMKLLIETLKADRAGGGNEAAAVMMSRMMEAAAMTAKTSIQMAEAMAEIAAPNEEHPAVSAIREGVSAIKVIMAGARDGAQRVIPKKQLPPGQQQVAGQARPPLTPQQVAQLRQQQAAQAQAARQVPPKPAPAPATAAAPPAVATVPTPTVEPVAAAPVEAAPVVPAVPTIGGRTHFEVLMQGIAEKRPVPEVVDYFFGLVKAEDASLATEMEKHGGSPFDLLQAHFGLPFIQANSGYFSELGTAVNDRGIEIGLWNDDEDGESAESAETEEDEALARGVEPVSS